jgi:hypothetical protein
MTAKALVALVFAAALSVVVAVVVSQRSGSGEVDPQTGHRILPDLASHLGDVARVTLVHGTDKTTLVLTSDHWGIEEKSGYPADAAKLHQVLLGLAELQYVEPKTRKAEFYPRLDVEDPGHQDGKSTLVTVTDAKGMLLGEIIAGKRRLDQLGGGSDGVYVRKPGDAQSWLARGTLDVSGDTISWTDRKVVAIPKEKVKKLVLTQPDGAVLDIARDKPEDALALTGDNAKAKLKSDTVLVEPADTLSNLELTDVRAAADAPLPPEGVAHAEITTFDGLTLKLALTQADGKDWVRIEASGTGDAEKAAAELNSRLGHWVYAIPDYKAKALRTKLADVVEPQKPS